MVKRTAVGQDLAVPDTFQIRNEFRQRREMRLRDVDGLVDRGRSDAQRGAAAHDRVPVEHASAVRAMFAAVGWNRGSDVRAAATRCCTGERIMVSTEEGSLAGLCKSSRGA